MCSSLVRAVLMLSVAVNAVNFLECNNAFVTAAPGFGECQDLYMKAVYDALKHNRGKGHWTEFTYIVHSNFNPLCALHVYRPPAMFATLKSQRLCSLRSSVCPLLSNQ